MNEAWLTVVHHLEREAYNLEKTAIIFLETFFLRVYCGLRAYYTWVAFKALINIVALKSSFFSQW